MKFEGKIDNSNQGFMFGLIILGPAAGKLKYTLLDKQDILLLQSYLLEAYVDIDRNGEGAHIFAFAYDVKKGKESGRFVHELLWEKHYGGIAPGFEVIHKNGITVDNRRENLTLCRKGHNHNEEDNLSREGLEQTLYWSAIMEIPYEAEPLYLKLFSPQEQECLMKERYFECHFPPCTQIESRPQEFSICGLCHINRYCSYICQIRDWTWHKPICNQRPRPFFVENCPER